MDISQPQFREEYDAKVKAYKKQEKERKKDLKREMDIKRAAEKVNVEAS